MLFDNRRPLFAYLLCVVLCAVVIITSLRGAAAPLGPGSASPGPRVVPAARLVQVVAATEFVRELGAEAAVGLVAPGLAVIREIAGGSREGSSGPHDGRGEDPAGGGVDTGTATPATPSRGTRGAEAPGSTARGRGVPDHAPAHGARNHGSRLDAKAAGSRERAHGEARGKQVSGTARDKRGHGKAHRPAHRGPGAR